MLENYLSDLGLSPKESQAFLASLSLGAFTVQELSRKTGIPRTTTYNQLKSLQEKGLVSEHIKKGRRFFSAQSPDRLLNNLRQQKRVLENREKKLKEIMPELKGLLQISKTRHGVEFFEGKAGIKAMQDDILNFGNLASIEELVPIDQAHQLFPPHKRDHRHRLRKALSKTVQRVIYTSENGKILAPKGQRVKRRFLSPDSFPLSCEINIYGQKVSMVTFADKPKGLILESGEIAESFRAMFYSIWKNSESS